MLTVKIISNPYRKEIRYQKLDEVSGEWTNIDSETSPHSKLLREEQTKGFFPFRAREIVDLIIEEYGLPEEPLCICFEGTDDEYQELEEVCSDETHQSKVSASRSAIELSNARDILPLVKDLFKEMSPLIQKSVSIDKIQRDLERFSDASSDVVPICVLGNYSAGKSTFINALIGGEILPSGNEPITAKIYKISRSKHPDRAIIKLEYKKQPIKITFTNDDTILEAGDGITLADSIRSSIEEYKGESIVVRVNKILTLINDFESDLEESDVSDLIEVSIPFTKGVLANTMHPFVIFDTPGSNSASNAKHLTVLKQAMANMTNGLPVFVCNPDSLDSTDNENLYHIIRDLENLDSRFTMIVVNKADNAGLLRKENTERERQRTLSQAVPRNLYSGGLFYVSSIMGLGAKIDGVFIDEVYEDIYDAQVLRYENPDNKHYRTLYLYDIMPAQIKARADKLAAQQKDLVYANSGLFTIETEIESFAGKYAAYNKCFQSFQFLNNVIEITQEDIEIQKDNCEEIRGGIRERLEEDKKALIERLELEASEKRNRFDQNYDGYMTPFLTEAEGFFTVEGLAEQEKIFTSGQEEEQGFEDRRKEFRDATGSITINLKQNLQNAARNIGIGSARAIFDGLQADITTAIESFMAQSDVRHEVDRAVADQLIEYVRNEYEKRLVEIHSILDGQSKGYWTEKTESLRKSLVEIVSGSSVLTDDKREELERIIITYEPLRLLDTSEDALFRKDNFAYRFSIGGITIFRFDHLNLEKLVKDSNEAMQQSTDSRFASIKESHMESAHNWITNLLSVIYNNIVDYSPELSKKARQIQVMTRQIEDLVQRQKSLKDFSVELASMMDWKQDAITESAQL